MNLMFIDQLTKGLASLGLVFGLLLYSPISAEGQGVPGMPSNVNAVADVDTACLRTSVNLSPDTVMPVSSDVRYQWQLAPAQTGPWSDLDTPHASPDYTVDSVSVTSFFRLEVYYYDTLVLTSGPVEVVVLAPEIISVSDSFRCGPGSIFLRAEASPHSSIRWYADDTASTPIGSGTLFETPVILETDTFYVNAVSDTGAAAMDCETQREMVIATVLPKPDLELGIDIDRCVNKGEYIMLNAGVHPGDPQYLWDDQSTGQILAIDTSGFHYVTVTNSFNCSSSDSIHVILRHNPELDLGQDTIVCENTTLTLHAGSDGIRYFWNTGSIDSVISVKTPGVYHVSVTNGQGCTQSDTIRVHMQGEPPALQGVTVDNLGPYSFRFSVLNPVNVMGYEWDFGDGSPQSYEEAPVHTYTREGSYNVTLRVNSTCGVWSEVVSANVVHVTDIDPGSEALLLYPNPATEEARIVDKHKDLKIEGIVLYDATGREVYTQAIRAHDIRIPLQGLPTGTYTLRIQMADGVAYRRLQVIK